MRIFDAIAKLFSTTGKRWDGTSYNEPNKPQGGYDPERKDFLPRNFGSELKQHGDGSYRGIASAEMVGHNGIWRRRFDTRPRRRINDDFLR